MFENLLNGPIELYRLRRNSYCNTIRRNIFCHYRSRTNSRTSTNGHPWHNVHIKAEPHILLDNDICIKLFRMVLLCLCNGSAKPSYTTFMRSRHDM